MTVQEKKRFGELKQIFKLLIHFPVITDISELKHHVVRR